MGFNARWACSAANLSWNEGEGRDMIEQDYYSITKKSFDDFAPFYNLLTLPVIRLRNKVVEFIDASHGSKILDVATGTGQQAFAFAKRGYDVTGIDMTESMLAIAQKNNRHSMVKLEIGDATKMRFLDESFNVSCISFALHDMPPAIREKVLREMVRVTQANGTIAIIDYDLPRNKIIRELIFGYVTLYESEYYKEFITSDLQGLLWSAGIEVINGFSSVLGAVRVLKGKRRESPEKVISL